LASAVQFYLHKCGQITLDVLKISKHKHRDPPLFVNRAEMELPLEEVPPISKNIKSFKKIIIRFAFFSIESELYKENK
jgi:hypothetical protein